MQNTQELRALFIETMTTDLQEATNAYQANNRIALAQILHRIEGGLHYTEKQLLPATQTLHHAIQNQNESIEHYFLTWKKEVLAALARD